MAHFKDKNNKSGKGKNTSLGQRKPYRKPQEQREEGGYFGNPHDKSKPRVRQTSDDDLGYRQRSNRFGGKKRQHNPESTVIEGGFYGNPFAQDEPKKRSYGEKRKSPASPNTQHGEKRTYGKRKESNNTPQDNHTRNEHNAKPQKRSYGEKKGFGGKKNYKSEDDFAIKSLLSDGEDLGFTDETSKRHWKDRHKTPRQKPIAHKEDNSKPLKRQKNTVDFEVKEVSGQVRLNRFIANAGVCSRREADKLIESGQITVNGKTMKELGYQVKPTDEVRYMGELLSRERPVYILLNKPKDHITTTEDPEGRKTVMNLVRQVGDDVRIYPVGRLDRNTTGLLMMTNDGKLAAKLAHPSSNIKKNYYVTLDKPISEEELAMLLQGIELEDGMAKFDSLEVLTSDYLNISVTLHSGKNRIVRRMFNQLGYEVERLDRVGYAGLTKKGLERGSWRYLTKAEVMRLKYLVRDKKD